MNHLLLLSRGGLIALISGTLFFLAMEGRAGPADIPSEAAPAAVAARDLPDRFAGAEVLVETTRALGDHESERRRVVRYGRDEKPVRLIEHLRHDPETGDDKLLYQGAAVADRILVSVDSAAALHELQTFLNGHDAYALVDGKPGARIRQLSVLGGASVESETALHAVEEAVEAIEAAGLDGIMAGVNRLYFPATEPNDPSYSLQWGLEKIDAPSAWDIATGSRGVYVAVIDSGIARNHPDLADNIAVEYGRNFVPDADEDAFDDQHGHGTRVSGIIGAVGNNGIGIAGVNWEVSLIPLRVGDGSFTTDRLADALDHVTDLRQQGVPVVATNNSYGIEEQRPPNQRQVDRILKSAIERSRDAGILFVAASGNAGEDMDNGTKTYPAAYSADLDNVIAVASTTGSDGLAGSSNYGQTLVHLGAPGQSIYSTTMSGSYGTASGTSFAAPFVAGALALMKAADPELDAADLKAFLLDTVDPIPSLDGKTITGGRLNLGAALQAVVPEAVAVPVLSLESSAPTLLRTPLYPVDLQVVADSEPAHDVAVSLGTYGDAVAGDDYAPLPPEVVLPAGETRVVFTLQGLTASETPPDEAMIGIEILASDDYETGDATVELVLVPHSFAHWQEFFAQHQPLEDHDGSDALAAGGDGIPDLLRYALGLVPGLPVPDRREALPALENVVDDGAVYPALSFNRPQGLGDIRYRLQVSESLAADSWQNAEWEVLDVTEREDGTERVTVRDAIPAGDRERRFLRLNVLHEDDGS